MSLRSPTASVILVNYRSSSHTLDAIAGLRGLDWDPAALQIIVVDNASADGSVDVLRAGAPDVTLIESPANLGFAGGCNLGMEHATGSYVGFLNPDARPHAQWLRAAVDALESDAGIGCVASKVLDADGERIDFVAAAMSFDGQGYKLFADEPASTAWDEPADVLFASGAAMVLPADVYRELGGFDERYFMFFEDVDLGWRAWLRGYRVRYVPASLAYHEHHVTMRDTGGWYERYLLGRNALFSVFKNYDDEHLAKVLPATILLTVRRAMAVADLDRHVVDLGVTGRVDDDPAIAVPREAVAGLTAVDSFIAELPALQAARAEVQGTRVRTDAEILRLFRLPLHANRPEATYQQGFDDIVRAFGIEGLFSERRRIVIATSDTLTARMAGPAIRAWNMAKVLSREHDVRLVTKARCDVAHTDFECRGGVDGAAWVELEAWCDVVIFQGFLLFENPRLASSDKVIVVDVYDPFHLEQLELSKHDPMDRRALEVGQSVRVLNVQVSRGDFFMCASEKQRDFWLGQLSAMQRVNPFTYDQDESLESLIAVVPFGTPEEPPVRTGPGIRGVVDGIGPDDKVLLWGGGIYNWFDPITLISAVAKLRTRIPEVRLFFLGTKHPNPDVPEMKMAWEARELARSLGVLDTHVFFNDGWVPYEERQNYFLDADIGVSTHLDHVETEFSFRTRILDYFWASLPVVATAGDTLGALIEQRGVGLTVPAGDVDALEEALHRLLTDDELRAGCAANAGRVADDFRWSKVFEPLVAFCRRAERAPDLHLRQPVVDLPTVPGLLDLLTAAARGRLAAARAAYREGGAAAVARRSGGWAYRRAAALRAR